MPLRRPVMALVSTLLSAGVIFAAAGAASAEAPPTWKVTPVIPSGLNSPRGLAFDNAGALYVAEAGTFNLDPNVPNQIKVTTGAVDKFRLGKADVKRVWSTPLEAIADTQHGAEVLGPAGLSNAGGSVVVIESGSQAGLPVPTTQMGHLLSLNRGNGKATDKADIGDQEYAWAAAHKNLHPSEFPDSNPTDVLVTRDEGRSRTFVVDAGANTVSEVMRDGTIRVIAYIPNDPPPPPDQDSTPTCVTQGPDGALYVGTLDLVKNFAFGPGHSNVFRIDPDTHESFLTAAHLWASGLTTVYGCTFDEDGNFWATEMFQPNPAGPPGDLVRIPFEHPNAIQHIGGTPLPGGIKQGPDGAMYVATNSPVAAPAGGVVKVSQTGD